MENYYPQAIQREDRLVKDIHLLIDLKIKNIENETNRLICSFIETDDTSRSFSVSWSIYGLAKLKAVFANNERIIQLIEKYSKAVNRLLRLRSYLDRENACRIIDLLSNDKFILCSEECILKALCRPAAVTMP